MSLLLRMLDANLDNSWGLKLDGWLQSTHNLGCWAVSCLEEAAFESHSLKARKTAWVSNWRTLVFLCSSCSSLLRVFLMVTRSCLCSGCSETFDSVSMASKASLDPDHEPEKWLYLLSHTCCMFSVLSVLGAWTAQDTCSTYAPSNERSKSRDMSLTQGHRAGG